MSRLFESHRDEKQWPHQQSHSYQRRVKSNPFSRLVFQWVTDSQYQAALSQLPINHKKIVLFCDKADGLGDIVHTFRAATVIKRNYPDFPLNIVFNCTGDNTTQLVQKLFANECKEFEAEFLGESYLPATHARVKEIIDDAGCLLGISLPSSAPLTHRVPYIQVREYGYSHILYQWDPLKDKLSMGFAPEEEGLLFPSDDAKPCAVIKTPWLNNALGGKAEPTNRLYYLYVHPQLAKAIGLYAVLGIEKGNNEPVDIMLRFKHSVQDFIQWKILCVSELEKLNVGKLIIFDENQPGGQEIVIGNGKGKVVRLLSGSLPRNEEASMQYYAQPFFGCSGDCSLTEAIKLVDKIPVFVSPSTKDFMLKSWRETIKLLGLNTLEKFLDLLFQQQEQENAVVSGALKNIPSAGHMADRSELVGILTDITKPQSYTRRHLDEFELPQWGEKWADFYLQHQDDLLSEARTFNTYAFKELNFEHRLVTLVARGLILHKNHPGLLEAEQMLWEQFRERQITEEQLVEEIRDCIDLMIAEASLSCS